MGMFPSKYFSPGGDEVNFKCYAVCFNLLIVTRQLTSFGNSPRIHRLQHDAQSQAELKSSTKTMEKALSSYVEQTHSVITRAGKTPVVWEEMVLRHKIKLVNDTVALSVLLSLVSFQLSLMPLHSFLGRVWKSSSHAARVAKKGYRIIHVPSDYFYLDCGGGVWTGDDPKGKSWCGT